MSSQVRPLSYKDKMAYRFSQMKKVVPVPAPLDTKSDAAFPALGSGSGSGSSGSGSGSGSGSSGSAKPVAKTAMDFKKIASVPAAPVQTINKIEPKKIMIKPSSAVPTRCYDELGEDYDGPDEWEEEKARDEYEVNASLPVGGRRGGF